MQKPSLNATKNRNGFSLIELMIALAIFSVGMLAIASAQIGTINANSKSRLYTEAAIVAQNQLEAFMNTAYAASDLDVGDHVGGMVDGRYGVRWTVDPVVDNMKTVHLAVEWTERSGKQKNITIDFISADYAIAP